MNPVEVAAMSGPMDNRTAPAPAAPRVSWKAIVIPAEHGGWGFLLEPAVLGLGIAFSTAGLLLAFSATAAFFARQPLKLWWMDRAKGRRYLRTAAAERAFALFTVAAALLAAASILLARGPVLFFLAVAAPLLAATLALDLARRGRGLAAELLAPIALGLLAPAIAAAAGWSRGDALILAALPALRALTSIPYVRTRLRLERGESPDLLPVALVHAAGLIAAFTLGATTGFPVLGVVAVGMLAFRAAVGLSPMRPRMSARQVGFAEIGLGAAVVALGVAGFRLA